MSIIHRQGIMYHELVDKPKDVDDMTTALELAHNSFYTTHSKNKLMNKNKQKFECAASISKQFDIKQLLEKTFYAIPTTNNFFLDYPLFKLFVNPDNYLVVVHHCISVINFLISTYGSFEIHVNLNSFTVSAAERYLPLIRLFCEECLKDTSVSRTDKLSLLYTYYTPHVITNIVPLFVKMSDGDLRKRIREQMTHYNKEQSEGFLEALK